ncbi:hypothetical protein, partial [Azorhizophilus paspali]
RPRRSRKLAKSYLWGALDRSNRTENVPDFRRCTFLRSWRCSLWRFAQRDGRNFSEDFGSILKASFKSITYIYF